MRRLLHILAVSVAVIFLSAACRKEGGKVIPRSTLSKIYVEMMLVDQWTISHNVNSRQTDTSLVYEPIFNKYGYTADDYRASVAYYLNDADRYARIIKSASGILEKRAAVLEKQINKDHYRDSILKRLEKYKPEKIYWLSGLYDKETFVVGGVRYLVDTAGGDWMFDPCKDIDTLWKGPMLIIPAPVDSAAFVADSLARADSLLKLAEIERTDSIARADSIRESKDKLVEKVRPKEALNLNRERNSVRNRQREVPAELKLKDKE